jgi:outer membrane protein assembly factor BamA
MKFLSKIPWFILLFGILTISAQDKPDSSQALVKRELLKTRKTHINAYPYLFYTPETELAFGVGGIITFYTSEYFLLRPSKLTLSGYYSTKKQYKITLSPQVYLARNNLFLSANLDYGYYVDRFWGIGSATPDIEDAGYISSGWGIELNLQAPPLLKLIGNTKTGIIYDYFNNTIEDKKSNPYLYSAEVSGSEGGISSGLGLIWVWDNRDHIFYPTKGGYHQVKAIFYQQAFGGDFDFNRYEIDLRQYVAIQQQNVLAFQAFVSFVRGNPPFYELSALGGQRTMRGYYQGRYRDKNYLAGQAEYRRHLWRRLGFVAFAGLGDVESETGDFRIKSAKFSGGFGLRFLFNQAEKVNIRADFGFGKNTSGVYFGLEEAF